MRCKSCNRNLSEEWNFCPNCGNKIVRILKFRLPAIKFGGADDFFENFQMPFGSGSIQISIGNPGRQRVVRQRIGQAPIKRIEKPQRETKKVVEPESRIRKTNSGIEIEIEMPGVSEEDIELKRIGESLEIRGYAKEKTYFKIVPVSRNLGISSQELNGSVLKIKIEK